MKIYDNGGQTFDRYTIIFDDGVAYGMSENATSPDGFNQYLGDRILPDKGLGQLVTDARSLPDAVRIAIINRLIDTDI